LRIREVESSGKRGLFARSKRGLLGRSDFPVEASEDCAGGRASPRAPLDLEEAAKRQGRADQADDRPTRGKADEDLGHLAVGEEEHPG
jgi:hypothetical protein